MILHLSGLTCLPTGDQRLDALYEVATENTRLAQDVLTAAMHEWLLAHDASGFRIVGFDVVIAEESAISPQTIAARLAHLTGILERLPGSSAAERPAGRPSERLARSSRGYLGQHAVATGQRRAGTSENSSDLQ